MAFAGNGGEVQHPCMRKAHGFKKAVKGADIANETLHLDLLAEVETVICIQNCLGFVGGPD